MAHPTALGGVLRRALAGAAVSVMLAAAPATAAQPWRGAEKLRAGLFGAQAELVFGSESTAAAKIRGARRAFAGELGRGLREADPAAARDLAESLAAAARAAARGNRTSLAAARGAASAALLRGAAKAAERAAVAGDARAAAQWLLVREFRRPTRFSRSGADATLAVQSLERGRLSPAATRDAIRRDLLDAYGARIRDALLEARRGTVDHLPERRAEALAEATGLEPLIHSRFVAERGTAAARRLRDQLRTGDVRAALANLEGFTAAPLAADEQARRAQQLLRFLALVPVEYGRGVDGSRVTKDFEIQEAVAFRSGAATAFADLRGALAKTAPAATRTAADGLERLGAVVDGATVRNDGVTSEDDVQHLGDEIDEALRTAMPDAWEQPTDESDYDLIALTLDRMEAAAAAGRWPAAEQARLEAYAFFEFGPERRLKSFDPGLAVTIEGLVWFGAGDRDGLAELIARKAPRRDLHATRLELDDRLADAAASLGDSASRATVVTNAAIIVFREGLEAVLILAAITASMVGVRRRLRRPVLLGALAGLFVSILTWMLAQTILSSLERHGEKLEAVVGLIAIGVLLVITNWFFHKVYWSEWIGRFHRRRKQFEKLERTGFISAQAVGLAILGLTSVYREGFETVLFLQSLELNAGTATVVEGAGLGLAATFAVGGLTFAAQRKLPYRRMLIVTGVFISLVLVVMVGQTARTMQGTGWLSITPIAADLPLWAGLWLGVFPTYETLGAQVLSAAFVVGSYSLAQEIRVKRPLRRAQRRPNGGPAGPAPRAVTHDGAPASVADR